MHHTFSTQFFLNASEQTETTLENLNILGHNSMTAARIENFQAERRSKHTCVINIADNTYESSLRLFGRVNNAIIMSKYRRITSPRTKFPSVFFEFSFKNEPEASSGTQVACMMSARMRFNTCLEFRDLKSLWTKNLGIYLVNF